MSPFPPRSVYPRQQKVLVKRRTSAAYPPDCGRVGGAVTTRKQAPARGPRVYGGEVDLHVQPLQKVYGDVAPRLERRHFPRRHQSNGFVYITAVREQSFGGIHFGSTFGWRARLDGYMMDFSKK